MCELVGAAPQQSSLVWFCAISLNYSEECWRAGLEELDRGDLRLQLTLWKGNQRVQECNSGYASLERAGKTLNSASFAFEAVQCQMEHTVVEPCRCLVTELCLWYDLSKRKTGS